VDFEDRALPTLSLTSGGSSGVCPGYNYDFGFD